MKKNRKLEYDLKNYLRLILMIFLYIHGFQIGYAQQNVLITDNNAINPDASSLLDLNSTTKGLLIPRVTLQSTTDGNTILLPATSLLVYNTNDLITNGAGVGYYYNAGTSAAPNWQKILTGNNTGGEWKLLGNANTSASNNFLGTTDNVDLVFRTNNIERIRTLASNGNVGIGTGSIPKGGIGAAKLAINGANASASGPHVQYTIDQDNYPVFQQLNYGHGYTFLNFDSYWDGAWKSSAGPSGNTGNFSISQQGNGLRFDYANVNTQGAAITWNSGMILNNTTGNVGIGTESPADRLVVGSAISLHDGGHKLIGLGYSPGSGNSLLAGYPSEIRLDPSSGNLSFGTDATLRTAGGAAGPTARMTIDRNGNVGIGTNSPVFKLDVEGDVEFGSGTSNLEFIKNGNTFEIRHHDPNVSWRDVSLNPYGGKVSIGTVSPTSRLTVQTAESNDGIYLTNGSGGRIHMIPGNVTDNSWNDIVETGDNVILFSNGNQNNGNLVIAPWSNSSTTTGVRIVGNNGYVGIGTPSPNFRLDLPNIGNAAGQGRANAWITYSDQRIKSNFQPIDALSSVMKLKPISYFQHDTETTERGILIKETGARSFGFLAQELYTILPEMVYKPVDETKDLWSVDYDRLIPILTKAIQEQQKQIDELKAENADLKASRQKDYEKLKTEIEWIKATLPKAEKD